MLFSERVFLFIVLVASIIQSLESLKVTICYEALCGDSIRFVKQQLAPNLDFLLNEGVQLEFLPYGKAVFSKQGNKYDFLCQHGPEECQGNKYQVCGLSQISRNQKRQGDFVACVMQQRNPAKLNTIEQCGLRNQLDLERLRTCASSPEGDQLLAQIGEKQDFLVPSISFVPTIVYNEKFNREDQDLSLRDFIAVVCSKLPQKPEICKDKPLPASSSYFF